MKKGITWVALDTSKKKHAVAVLGPGGREPRGMQIPNEAKTIRRLARKLVREAPGEVRVCYEAGPCGFVLQRQLEEAAPELVCEVVALALTPVRPGDRVKTDRRYARKLVRLYRLGELTVVQPPTESGEAVRDLMRCREASQQGGHRGGSGVRGIHLGGFGGGESLPRQVGSLVWDQEGP